MNIFVGCSSRDTNNEKYNDAAIAIGRFIAKGEHNFIFGGCKHGLMGKVYSEVLKNRKAKIIVSISDAYIDQLNDIKYDEIYTFSKMSERKEAMLEMSDIIVFLPGGIGTIDELMTAIETKRNHEQNKPIIIANTDGYFDVFFQMIEKTFNEKFADYESKNLYTVVNSVDEIIEACKRRSM